jgi:sigma-B regulation protein RsbU (phosphoserine phosphatase)
MRATSHQLLLALQYRFRFYNRVCMKLPFSSISEQPSRTLRKPAPANVPALQTGSLAACYGSAPRGGDFFDFVSVGGRLLFMLLDISGARDQALDIATGAQEVFRAQAVKLFSHSPLNESDALSDLIVTVNRAIIAAVGGARLAPAFLGCYDEDLGTVTYINAGHIPALVKDSDGVSLLAANGLPLGLFSHATHDAQIWALQPGAALLLVSKGLIESRSRNREFGLERVQKTLEALKFVSATELCSGVLTAVQRFTNNTPAQDGVTVLSLMRAQVPALASAAVSKSR